MIDTALLESYPCPVCGSADRQRLFEVKKFTLVRCRVCSMVYVDPRIANEHIYEIYTDHYFRNPGSGYDNYELAAHLRVRTFERWYRQVQPHLLTREGPALDIGCAAGYFMEVLRREGWAVEGIELDPDMLGQVRTKGFTAVDTPLEYFEGNGPYALITLFDVLEHLPALRKDMAKLAGLLQEDGTIALVTPDFGSLQRRFFGKRWFQLKPTEHIQYFTSHTLRRLAGESGLELVQVIPSGQFADLSFLHNRLERYGFPRLARLFGAATRLLGIHDRMWYVGTGSMLAILRKK